MTTVVLMYHDVLDGNARDSSGFPGPAAGRYKLAKDRFVGHLEAIREVAGAGGVGVLRCGSQLELPRVLLTFDDGGVSALTIVEPLLSREGWRGHFFITTDYVGTRGFVGANDIRSLHDRGHVIGSHSCSHPPRMAALSREAMIREWAESRKVLSDLTGADVVVGSVPGGSYSRRVAEAAAAAGIRVLFTSEPTASVADVDGCRVFGRYHLLHTSPPRFAGRVVEGDFLSRSSQALGWTVRKAVRQVMGRAYAAIAGRIHGTASGERVSGGR
jgi:peptidoglycan/xylan/chitin deacetylase (PgdA/CDA1 family)